MVEIHLAPSHFLLCIHKKVIYAYQYLSNTETMIKLFPLQFIVFYVTIYAAFGRDVKNISKKY